MARKTKKRKRPRAKPVGTWLFFRDAMNDEAVNKCSYAAQGLWWQMWFRMGESQPIQGVVPGQLPALAEAFGIPTHLREAWVGVVAPLVEELERAGVFSRGAEIKERHSHKEVLFALPDDAICNRRLVDEWVDKERVRVRNQQNARKAWGPDGARRNAKAVPNECEKGTKKRATKWWND